MATITFDTVTTDRWEAIRSQLPVYAAVLDKAEPSRETWQRISVPDGEEEYVRRILVRLGAKRVN